MILLFDILLCTFNVCFKIRFWFYFLAKEICPILDIKIRNMFSLQVVENLIEMNRFFNSNSD